LRLTRNRLIDDGIFNMRLKLPYLPLAIGKSLRLRKSREPLFDQYHMVRTTDAETGKDVDDQSFRERLERFYKNFDTHHVYLRHVEELAALIKQDGARLLLIQLPNRSAYQQEVDRLYPAEYTQHLRAATDLAARIGVQLHAPKFPEEIGVKDSDFIDYGHMAKSGAEAATKWLITLVK